jgi:lysyl-tRNA synthetase, class I
MDEIMHWADRIAAEVEERAKNDPILKEVVNRHGYIVYDEKTPSGRIHIGSGRGWIIHDVIAKAMREKGMKAEFILSSDDTDPFDKMNSELDPSYEKYLGMPFRNIPSPVQGYKSFADYYMRMVTDKFPEFGIVCKLESTGERYSKGDFNKAIKAVLDNHVKVNAIFERVYGKAPDKLPFNPICENCGKIATTKSYEWDPLKEKVKYECVDLKYTKGCGHKGEVSPYNGTGKLPWKVEWAAKWPTVGVSVELAGKDHFSKGGSRTVSIAISDEVLDFPPPYPSTRKETGNGYEFFNVGGKKMSTSKGRGIGFAEVTQYVTANILRYLLVSTRPNAAIDFDPITKNDLLLLYDRFDKIERIYFGAEEADEQEKRKQNRIYELSHIGEIPSRMPPQVPFTLCASTIQVALDPDRAIRLLQSSGHLPDELSAVERSHIISRLSFADNWVKKFAPEQYRFRLRDSVPDDVKASIGDAEKKALKEIALSMDHDEASLHNAIYEAAKRNGLESKALFRAAYRVLIGKDQGPRLAAFLLTIGKGKTEDLFCSL